MRSTEGAAERSGRKARRSQASARSTTTAQTVATSRGTGQAPTNNVAVAALRGYDQDIAADHDEVAMGEVDQAHDAENESDAQRGQGIEAAEREGVDRYLDELVIGRTVLTAMSSIQTKNRTDILHRNAAVSEGSRALPPPVRSRRARGLRHTGPASADHLYRSARNSGNVSLSLGGSSTVIWSAKLPFPFWI